MTDARHNNIRARLLAIYLGRVAGFWGSVAAALGTWWPTPR